MFFCSIFRHEIDKFMKNARIGLLCWLSLLWMYPAGAQEKNEWVLPQPGEKTLVNTGWFARRANEVAVDGSRLSASPVDTAGWLPARVPGTVLTTLLENNLYPAPEFGTHNNLIPDIYEAGRDFYTYWFIRPFEIRELPAGRTVWLNLRGINYRAELFLNGKRLNRTTHEGMFLRKSYDITPYLRTGAPNLLAVIVYPPDPVGNPNGGQGGDGRIAQNVTMQYTPGWDWIQPVRDRNTGIWDEVSLTTTGPVRLQSPYIRTQVPGRRFPNAEKQKEAFVHASVEVENTTDQPLKGLLICETDGRRLTQSVSLSPNESREVAFPVLPIKHPRLWWPNGIGAQPLYDMRFSFEIDRQVSDRQQCRYGIREITTEKCSETGGRMFFVNGQKMYMPGGNYINSDWLLRLSPERYRDEVRFHAEMNLRMIRVWGGALLERPEFYEACDAYGLLVFQDLWGSGDCNGAWEDPMKKDSRERRREYPDNHALFIASVEDQVKMIRNHPSLCFWCGANEWPLAKDIDKELKETVFPKLDPGRLFVSFSTDTVFTRNLLGDNGDGPYGIREPEWFFTFRSHPFNPEAGSVGSPEIESMREMMSEADLKRFPRKGFTRNYVWRYHKDLGYGDHLERYGEVKDIETYCKYAQAVNYDQYRSFMEGWASHLWDWYTGILIWKTQNPWTALRGQMYDWYMDVNACLYGTRKGCEPLHPFYNPATREVALLNSGLEAQKALTVRAQLYDRSGKVFWEAVYSTDVEANQVKRLGSIPTWEPTPESASEPTLKPTRQSTLESEPEPEPELESTPKNVKGVYFLKLSLLSNKNEKPQPLFSQVYWLTTVPKDYTTLNQLPPCRPVVRAFLREEKGRYKGKVSLEAVDGISFFNRVKVLDKETGKQMLPVHYSDNYLTLMPGDREEIEVDFPAGLPKDRIRIVIDSWTAERLDCPLDRSGE